LPKKRDDTLAATTNMRIHILAILFSTIAHSQVWALDFSVVDWRGRKAILAAGNIVFGDAGRLKSIASSAEVWPHGHRVLLLDSPGGMVHEALQMSRVIRDAALHTVVPKGAVCASACGAVLFVAGRYRTIEEGGTLGMHTCYAADTMKPVPECNEDIAMHAVENGVAHGSVKAFMEYTPPEEMIFFSRENAECWGITRYLGETGVSLERSNPCVMQAITGRMPPPQDAWRIGFKDSGYAAFVRVIKDSALPGQVELFCKESDPGRLFLEVLIPAEVTELREAIKEVKFFGLAKPLVFSNVIVSERESDLASVRVSFDPQHVIPLLTRADKVRIEINLRAPYDPIVVRGVLGESRKNLIFAANNCIE
jgi:hypothetical protein